MTSPLISIIVPLYQGERFIARALDSVLTQRFPNWECLVIDDGSTDSGPDIARRFAERDPRFRIVRQSNQGLSAARNAGIVRSRAPWLLFLDHDDWLLPAALGALHDSARAASHGLVCAGTEWFDEHGAPLGFTFAPNLPIVTLAHLAEANRFQVHAALLSRSALGDLRFDESLPALEDWRLWQRLAAHGRMWHVLDRTVAAYRLRPSSMSRDPRRMWHAAQRVIAAAFHDLAALDPMPRQDAERVVLARVALEQLAAFTTTRDDADAAEMLPAVHALAHMPETLADLTARALHWRIPFLRCLPPIAWRSETHAPALARDARAFLDALQEWGGIAVSSERDILHRLAMLAVEPRRVARRIIAGIPPARPIVLYGLGVNAAALLESMPGVPRDIFGVDDALCIGDHATVGSHGPIPVIRPADAPPSAIHVITVTTAPALAARVPPGISPVRWHDALTRESFDALRSLMIHLAPRAGTVHGAAA